MISQTIFPAGEVQEGGTPRTTWYARSDIPKTNLFRRNYRSGQIEEGLRLSDRGKERVINFSPRGCGVKITDNGWQEEPRGRGVIMRDNLCRYVTSAPSVIIRTRVESVTTAAAAGRWSPVIVELPGTSKQRSCTLISINVREESEWPPTTSHCSHWIV